MTGRASAPRARGEPGYAAAASVARPAQADHERNAGLDEELHCKCASGTNRGPEGPRSAVPDPLTGVERHRDRFGPASRPAVRPGRHARERFGKGVEPVTVAHRDPPASGSAPHHRSPGASSEALEAHLRSRPNHQGGCREDERRRPGRRPTAERAPTAAMTSAAQKAKIPPREVDASSAAIPASKNRTAHTRRIPSRVPRCKKERRGLGLAPTRRP
jgi:hypothetical protein